jgi:hypothetical protein
MENITANIYLLIGGYIAANKRPSGMLWLAKIGIITLFWPIVLLHDLLQQKGK